MGGVQTLATEIGEKKKTQRQQRRAVGRDDENGKNSCGVLLKEVGAGGGLMSNVRASDAAVSLQMNFLGRGGD